MLGLRNQEDSKFENFFSIVQDAAQKLGGVFFLDCGEGRDFETDALSGEDLSGWLIPSKHQDSFVAEFESGEVSEKWAQFICFAIWTVFENTVTIEFKKY